MKKIVLPLFALAYLSVVAQKTNNKRIFAITGSVKGSVNWNALREIDATNGTIAATLFAPTLSSEKQQVASSTTANDALQLNIAATAYDAKHNRLYFTNMHGNELKYYNLNQTVPEVVTINNAAFNTGNKFTSEANIVTRMALGADGFGYAITNDGEQLVRFSTDETPVISNLGRLIEGNIPKDNSLHNQCTGWGGDIVSDVYGNLYLINVKNNVYKINVQSRIADFLGTIKGLPNDFFTNGAAVNEAGELIVSSAAYTKSYFKVDIENLTVSSTITNELGVYNASDLASSNLLFQSLGAGIVNNTSKASVSLFPNPAVGKNFQLKFDNISAGSYQLQVSDASGRIILQNNRVLTNSQTLPISLNNVKQGLYYIKIINANNTSIFNNKIIVP